MHGTASFGVSAGRCEALYQGVLIDVGILLATVAPAHAYIDPGSGLLLWQLLVSAFAGTVLYQCRKIVNFIFRRQHKQKKPDE